MVSSEYKVVSIIFGLGTQSKKKIEKFAQGDKLGIFL